jgi:hypothetical protein
MKNLLLVLSLLCGAVHAEVLFGIQYSATLGMVKKLYPNAEYTKQKPAWLQPDEAFFKISGRGMSGEIFVAFVDPRPLWSTYTAEKAIATLQSTGKTPTQEQVDHYINFARSMASSSDDDALSISWVRWVPDRAIPLRKLESRYGKASCSLDEAFNTACSWAKRSLVASMGADGKAAMYLETDFTKTEREQGVVSRVLRPGDGR